MFKKLLKKLGLIVKVNNSVLLEIFLKKKELESKSQDINTLVLGSSHGAYGVNPFFFNNSIFNLCTRSQDLYYSYHLYKTVVGSTVGLKSVCLFFSGFSSGFELQKTADKEICAYFKHLYGIDYKFVDDTKELKRYIKGCKRFCKRRAGLVVSDTWGYNPSSTFFSSDFPVKVRTENHHRENIRNNDQIEYLEKLYKSCKANNHSLVVIIPPARGDYIKYMPNESILFKKLFNITEKLGIKVLNLYSSKIFSFEDFGDFDHLNEMGAVKLSKAINTYFVDGKDEEK